MLHAFGKTGKIIEIKTLNNMKSAIKNIKIETNENLMFQ